MFIALAIEVISLRRFCQDFCGYPCRGLAVHVRDELCHVFSLLRPPGLILSRPGAILRHLPTIPIHRPRKVRRKRANLRRRDSLRDCMERKRHALPRQDSRSSCNYSFYLSALRDHIETLRPGKDVCNMLIGFRLRDVCHYAIKEGSKIGFFFPF